MGLFGSIGKFLGGVVKGVGKVASVAGAIAPIPGLGIAGKVASGLGGVLSRGKRLQGRIESVRGAIMPGGAPVLRANGGARAGPAVASDLQALIYRAKLKAEGVTDAQLVQLAMAERGSTARDERGSYSIGQFGEVIRPKKKRTKAKAGGKSRKRSTRRRTTRRRRGRGRRGLTRAQLRAGFGGKRRMRG